ncbi:C-type lectin domain family 17, member A-like [Crassostrea virginica]
MRPRTLWILAVVPVLVFSSECPGGWIPVQGTCYYFSRTTETWSDASTFCQSFGAKLAEPQTSADIAFLSGEIQAFGGPSDYWVGITDLMVENQFVYDSSITPIHGHNWGPNEPNGHRGENCVIISGYFHGKYADVDCHSTRKFICERVEKVDGLLVG